MRVQEQEGCSDLTDLEHYRFLSDPHFSYHTYETKNSELSNDKTAAYEEISDEKANGPFEIVNRLEKYTNLCAAYTLTEDSNPRGDVEILLEAPERYQPDVLNSQSFDHLIQTDKPTLQDFLTSNSPIPGKDAAKTSRCIKDGSTIQITSAKMWNKHVPTLEWLIHRWEEY